MSHTNRTLDETSIQPPAHGGRQSALAGRSQPIRGLVPRPGRRSSHEDRRAPFALISRGRAAPVSEPMLETEEAPMAAFVFSAARVSVFSPAGPSARPIPLAAPRALPRERSRLDARWHTDATGRPVCAWLVRALHPDPVD
ncbi:hypothetical protein NFI95_01370 [Acetobacteraceae bacterium KSS8]|uniref:Uncharacterized protein n=1 Tax=Endosaccharibacter trunci TaxID=2812733 RepID=A0ABT1W2L5_9PROT|nr:hypothetical protein [Acetobacteraceae bacterium KSS8]